MSALDNPNTPGQQEFYDLLMSIFITQARLYDLQMTMLNETHPELAKDILEVHYNGGLFMPTPAFSGEFISNVLNEQVEDHLLNEEDSEEE